MNISELARHLDLAVSTVSRVLSGHAGKYRISQRTADRVQKAAIELGVTPDPLGAGLRRGTLGMIGLLVPDITNPFFSHLAREIELRLRDSGFAVQLCDSAEDPETELKLLGHLLSRRLDGLILAPVGVDSEALSFQLRRTAMPLIIVDRVINDPGVPSVSIDNVAAGRLAAEHLLAAGHRRIACLRGNPASRSDEERLRGVYEALEDAGVDHSSLMVAGESYTHEENLKAATTVLQQLPAPTGIITLSGQGILGLLRVADERGLSIPGALSVVAFDEQPWSRFMRPPLTTISQPIAEMAAETVQLLLQRLDGIREIAASRLPASLLCRDSVTML
jgi:LacI family transcriptional regulator